MDNKPTIFDEPIFQFSLGILSETLAPSINLGLIETKEMQAGRATAQFIPSFPIKFVGGIAGAIISAAEHYDLHPDPDMTPWDYVP